MKRIDVYQAEDGNSLRVLYDHEMVCLRHRHDLLRTDGGSTFDLIELDRSEVDIGRLIEALKKAHEDLEVTP